MSTPQSLDDTTERPLFSGHTALDEGSVCGALRNLFKACSNNTAAYADWQLRNPDADPVFAYLDSHAQRFTHRNRRAEGPDGLPSEPLTLFHSTHVPAATLVDVAKALVTPLTRCEWAAAAAAVVLVRRYERKTRLPVTALMAHRLFVTCFLVATKVHNDFVPTNGLISHASGIGLAELNRLERALLAALDWRATVTFAEVSECFTGLAVVALPPPAVPRRGAKGPVAQQSDSFGLPTPTLSLASRRSEAPYDDTESEWAEA